MRAVGLAGPLTDPQEVGRAVVPVAGEAVAASERLLVLEEQGLVRRVEVDLVQLHGNVQVDAARGHEAQRAIDLAGEDVVAPALGAAADELEVPLVHAVQVGEAALGEGAQQVQCRRGLVVAADHAHRIGPPGELVEGEVVDHVAAERREIDAVTVLDRRGAGLGEWPGDAPDLQRRDARAVRQRDRHLEDDLQLVADVVGRELGERLGAVAGVQQETVAARHAGQRVLQRARLAREHERRHRAQLLERVVEHARVGPGGFLRRGTRTPRRWLPAQVR